MNAKKTDIHNYYGHTKGGADVVDFVSSHSKTKMEVNQRVVNLLAFPLNTVRINAKTILAES